MAGVCLQYHEGKLMQRLVQSSNVIVNKFSVLLADTQQHTACHFDGELLP